jgi:Protein of unknown function (DUF1153)
MYESARVNGAQVIGPFGPLTIADLPSPRPQRWSVRRKADVITAVRGGLLSLQEACSRYALDVEEYFSWEHRLDRYGVAGLRTTRTQLYTPNGKAQRSPRRYRPNGQAKIRTGSSDTVPSTVCEHIANTEGGKLFAIGGVGNGFTQYTSNDGCKDAAHGTSIKTLSMNRECRSDFDVAWLGTRTIIRLSGSIMENCGDIRRPAAKNLSAEPRG